MNINTSTDTKEKRYKCCVCGRKRYFRYLVFVSTIYDIGCSRHVDKYRCKREVSYYSFRSKCIAPGSKDKITAVKLSKQL